MQIGCNKDLVCLSACVYQLTGAVKWKNAVWCCFSSNFSCPQCFWRFCSLPEAWFQIPLAPLSSYFSSFEQFVFLIFLKFFCALCLQGILEEQAVMQRNMWHYGFRSHSWPSSHVIFSELSQTNTKDKGQHCLFSLLLLLSGQFVCSNAYNDLFFWWLTF